MKVCRKCGEMLPLDGYYKHAQMGDGHLNICKTCTKDRVNRYRKENIERIQEYDRNRPNRSERREKNKLRSRKVSMTSDEWQQKLYRNERYRKRYPERHLARTLVGHAIRDGKLKPKPCEWCRSVVDIHAHHEDYTKPLDVTWLCISCHGQRHQEINEEKRQQAGG